MARYKNKRQHKGTTIHKASSPSMSARASGALAVGNSWGLAVPFVITAVIPAVLLAPGLHLLPSGMSYVG